MAIEQENEGNIAFYECLSGHYAPWISILYMPNYRPLAFSHEIILEVVLNANHNVDREMKCMHVDVE